MIQPALGIDLQDLRIDTRSAMNLAAKMEFRSIELPAAQGETTPQNLSPSGRRHLQKIVADLGLSMSSITADFPGLRLSDPKTTHERIEKTCAIIELAADMKVPVVTSSVGALTHPESGKPSDAAVAALRRLGEFADSRGRILAIRPSFDAPQHLAAILKIVACPWIKIGLDPAALVMSGVNPTATSDLLTSDTSLVHLRDAVRGHPDRPGQETRLGEGEVDLRGFLAALSELEYQGPIILRRTDSVSPAADLLRAREFLRQIS